MTTVWEQVAPVLERSLIDEHLDHLVQSGIAPEVIAGRGYYTLTKNMVIDHVQLETYDPLILKGESWLAIPMFRPDGVEHADIIRVFGPDVKRKYIYPTGVRNCVDLNPMMKEKLFDRNVPFMLTEGVKKADAILSAALAEGIDVLPLSINGCWGWRVQIDGGKIAVPDFEDIPLNDRVGYVVPDSDYRTNDNVRQGWNGATTYLESKTGERRTFLAIPPADGRDKQGADDYLARGGSLHSLLGLAESPKHAAVDQASERIPIRIKSGRELIAEANEAVPHLLSPLIPERSITLMAGHSGTFKTWHGLSVALDGAFGIPWLGHPDLTVDAPFTTLYVNKEMSGAILGQRLKTLARNKKYADLPNYEEVVEQRLAFADDAQIDLQSPEQQQRLEDVIFSTGATFVVLDSLSMCWYGDENSASEVGRFFGQLRLITERCGCAWCIILHFNKPQSGNKKLPLQFSIRGSSQLYNQADAALIFQGYDPDGPHVNGERLVSITHAKARTSVELPAWMSRFDTNDGIFTSMDYTGKLSEAKALEYRSSHGDTEKLGEWIMTVLWDMPMMHPTGPGLRTPALLATLSGSWTLEGVAPSDNNLRRQINHLVGNGTLEVIDDNRRLGHLYRLKDAETPADT